MDSLINDFARLLQPLFYRGESGGVYCRERIPTGTVLCEVVGTRRYIWEIEHTEYVIIDRDYVMDIRGIRSDGACRTILSAIREENATASGANCTISVIEDEGAKGAEGARFFIRATRDIEPGEEIVYYVVWWF